MHSDYTFKRVGTTQPAQPTRKPATAMPDLPAKSVQAKPRKPRTKREREATIYEQPLGAKLKAFFTGKAPKKLTKKRRAKR
jgi:hypothetical protein